MSQRIEVASQRHQLRVSPLLDDPAVFKDQNPVTILDSAQSVRDRNRCLSLYHRIQSIKDRLFGVGIKSTGKLVKQEKSGLFDQASAECDSLFLPP